MKKILVSFLVGASTLAFAQTERNVGDFTLLKVYDRISVELIPLSKNMVEILGNNDSDVQAINKNGELKIRMAPTKVMQGEGTKVKVYYENLTDIQGSQGAIITASEAVKSSMLTLTSNEGSKLNLSLNTQKLKAKGNSGGEIIVKGKADSQDIVMSSGSKFNGMHVESSNASVTVNAGGVAKVFAEDSVETTTRAGGTIEVYGDPKNRNTKKVIGGKVVFK